MKLLYLLFLLACSNPSFAKVVTVDSAGGGDFTTVQEGLDDFDINQAAVAGHDTLKICKGTYVENIAMPAFTGLNAANNFFIMACAGDEHNGDSATGVEIQMSAAWLWNPANERTKVHNIIFNITDSTDVTAVNIQGSYYARCMFFITSGITATGVVMDARFATLTNSVVDVNIVSTANQQRCVWFSEWGNGYGYVVNSIVRGCPVNFLGGKSYNTIAIIYPALSTADCWKTPDAASDYNICIKDGAHASADTTAPGANSLVKTLAQVGFTDSDAENFHITSSSHAFNVGTDGSGYDAHVLGAFRAIDMDGDTWAQWSMGFDQPEFNPVNITNPNSTNNKISGDSGKITITGTYAGTPDSLQWRYGAATGWMTLDAAPSGGTFSENLSLPNTYGSRYVVVRQKPDTAFLDSVQLYMGHIRIWAGQSNAQGSGTTDIVFSENHEHLLYEFSAGWRALENPVEPSITTNSVLPYLASLIAENYPDSIPQIWVYYGKARGCTYGTDAAKLWCPDTTGGSFDSLVIVKNNSNADYIKDFLFFQGESDATAMTTGQSGTIYQTRKSNMLDSLRTRFSQPEIVGFLGYIGFREADSINAVRVAQQNLGAAGNWKPTTPTYDVDYSTQTGDGTPDGAHFKDSIEQVYQGNRVYRGWASHYGFPGGQGRGPVLSSAVLTDSLTVTLTFTMGSGLTLAPSSPRKELFRVVEDSTRTISTATASGNAVTLVLGTPLTLAATISIGHTNDGKCPDTTAWSNCLRDNGTYPAPPEMVLSRALTEPPEISGGARKWIPWRMGWGRR